MIGKNSRSILSRLALPFLLSVPALMTVQSARAADFDESGIEKYLSSEKGQDAVGKAVESYFKRRQDVARKQQEEQALAEMEEQFKNPTKIDVGDSPVKGPKDAKVTIVEFSDFECPYCKRGTDTMTEVMKAYPKDVKVVFKQLPLPFHKNATPAAKAALAAGKQNKFWEFHDELFNNQGALGEDFYVKTAEKLGLNVAKFKEDMASEAITKQIEAEKALAEKNGIQGTPGFFVNGVAVKGAYPVDHFKRIIDRWINGPAKTAKS